MAPRSAAKLTKGLSINTKVYSETPCEDVREGVFVDARADGEAPCQRVCEGIVDDGGEVVRPLPTPLGWPL